MASPAKRRKKNDYHSSPSAGRLEHFFAKQQAVNSSEAGASGGNLANDDDPLNPANSEEIRSNEAMTDEEIARKLQEEWNNEPVSNSQGTTTFKDAKLDNTGEGSAFGGKDVDITAGDAQREEVHISHHSEEDHGPGLFSEPIPADPDTHASSNQPPVKNSLSLQSTASAEDPVTLNIPFDENPLTFQPSNYMPELQRHWASEGGGEASYALLTRCFVLVNSTTSRIKIVDTLVNFLRLLVEADPESLLPAVWLATNSIAPPYVSMELGLGGSAISKALKKVCGLDNHALKVLYHKHGDAGDVAFEAKKRQSYTFRKPKPLTIKGVYQLLVKIANSKGNGSQEVKQRLVERLLQDARGPEESRYIVRTLAQHLRIGAVKTTMLIALSRALVLSRPPGADFPTRSVSELVALKKDALAEIYAKGEEIVKACYARRPNYNDLVPALLEIGVCEELLLRCGLALHIPLRPMLGSITRDLSEMLTKLQGRDFSCEFKYDGQRAQIHCDDGGKVSIFSRHLELMTDKYPDLVALVPKIRGEGVSSFILEGEVVAIDRKSGELKAFQTLANRGRKDVVLSELEIDVCLFAFDLMFLNGEELLGRPFRERRELLRSLFVEVPGHFTWVKSIDATSSDSEVVLDFFKSATEIKCEGIMVKVLDNLPKTAIQNITGGDTITSEDQQPPVTTQPASPTKLPTSAKAVTNTNQNKEAATKGGRRKALLATYEPDKRLDSWLKVKKDYDTAFDTLDLIPIAGWHGTGRKAKWWSPILLAVRNPDTGSLQAVCKCISGFTDKFYQGNKEKYASGSDNVLGQRPAYVEYWGTPDIWFEPQEVWEMAFADITISPTYTAAIGLVSEEKGLSLRFPRFLKKREDKGIEEASTCDSLADLWKKQEAKGQIMKEEKGMKKGIEGEEEDMEE
ncbi:MAG: hypothetical protein M1816_008202 [Peltula sp. TS41687]|nr:MAG: hypothetical protein M1816_008202 [Peltula sp. TS41687]